MIVKKCIYCKHYIGEIEEMVSPKQCPFCYVKGNYIVEVKEKE